MHKLNQKSAPKSIETLKLDPNSTFASRLHHYLWIDIICGWIIGGCGISSGSLKQQPVSRGDCSKKHFWSADVLAICDENKIAIANIAYEKERRVIYKEGGTSEALRLKPH